MMSAADPIKDDGEMNEAFEPESDQESWPSFKQKLAHFNSLRSARGQTMTVTFNSNSPSPPSKTSQNQTPDLSIASNLSNPPTPDSPRVHKISTASEISLRAPPPPSPSLTSTSASHSPLCGHTLHDQCHKCLVAKALEEVLKHQAEGNSGPFVVEISEGDKDHEEFIKMIVTPAPKEMFGFHVETESRQNHAEIDGQRNLNEIETRQSFSEIEIKRSNPETDMRRSLNEIETRQSFDDLELRHCHRDEIELKKLHTDETNVRRAHFENESRQSRIETRRNHFENESRQSENETRQIHFENKSRQSENETRQIHFENKSRQSENETRQIHFENKSRQSENETRRAHIENETRRGEVDARRAHFENESRQGEVDARRAHFENESRQGEVDVRRAHFENEPRQGEVDVRRAHFENEPRRAHFENDNKKNLSDVDSRRMATGTKVVLQESEELEASIHKVRHWHNDHHHHHPEAIEEEDEDIEEYRNKKQDRRESEDFDMEERRNAIKLAISKVSPGNSSGSSIEASAQSVCEKESSDDGEEGKHKEEWSSPVEFLLSCIAMSVGLGNVWRFPFTAYENGGGAFLIPYLFVLFLIGRPLYFMELSMGQFSSKSSVRVWDMVPAFRGVGYGQAIANSSVVSYYTSLIALSFYYMCASFNAVLPWTVCDPDIELEDTVCIQAGENATEIISNMSLPANITAMSSAEQYFLHSVLHHQTSIEDGIGLPILSLVGCLAICYTMLFLTLWKGVSSSGKVAYFTAIFPYIVLITLLVRGVTLPGSINGIMFYITPKWGELLNVKVWYNAVTQSFFSLSVGFGALINYSSHCQFRHNVYRDAMIISITDTLTSLLAGFTIFSILGNLAEELGVPVDEVVSSGTGLAFISYPMAIAKFEYAPQVFSVLFFLMLITLGLGSATGLISSVIGIIHDAKPGWNKTLISLMVCVTGFGIGLVYITPGGQHILNLVDFFGGGFIIFILTILEVFAVCWVYGLQKFLYDIFFMLNRKLGIYYKFCWGILIPAALIFFFGYYLIFAFPELGYSGVPYPKIAVYAGWTLTGIACVQVPFWLFYSMYFIEGETLFKKFQASLKPAKEWGPKNKLLKQEWKSHHVARDTRREEKKQMKAELKQRKKEKK